MKYPYVVASLPVLILGERPPFSARDFIFRCEGPLTQEDLCCLRRLLEGQGNQCKTPFARAWHRSERHLRLAVAQVRAGRIGVDMHKYMEKYRTLDPDIQHVVVDAFAKTNPLERERVLDEFRWRLLDELSFNDPFGLAPVLAFGVKLQIADRWADLETKRGAKAYDEQTRTILEQPEAVTA